MPTYEYLCDDCKKTFEAFQKITDEPISVCPNCGGAQVKRLLSATAFHLKGSGWYKTDYSSSPSLSTDSTKESAPSSPTEPKSSAPASAASDTTASPSSGGAKPAKSESDA